MSDTGLKALLGFAVQGSLGWSGALGLQLMGSTSRSSRSDINAAGFRIVYTGFWD